MPDQPSFIFRTPKQDEDFAILCGKAGAEEALKKAVSDKETLMHLTDEEIYRRFRSLKEPTLRLWCREGKLGKPGKDGAYWVSISEIENYLFQNSEKKKKK